MPQDRVAKVAKRVELTDRVQQSVLKRLQNKDSSRNDFFSHLISDKAIDVSEEFLRMQSQTLVVAGSETTSTALASIFYHLSKDQQKLKHLTREVRAAFSDPSQISGDSTQGLPYLFGVIEEGKSCRLSLKLSLHSLMVCLQDFESSRPSPSLFKGHVPVQ
jgi:cytochrome P450